MAPPHSPTPAPQETTADTRERLLQIVRACPGATQSEAARALDLDYSTIQYHVRRLARTRTVRLVVLNGVRRLYLPEDEPSPAARAASALTAPGARDVLHLARTRNGCTVRDVVAAMKIPRSTAHERLTRLTQAGVLTAEDNGLGVVYHANASAE